MKATQLLHDLGQSLWPDNVTRELLNSGMLKRYIDELSVTGLTSNPTIFDHAIKNSAAYDATIRKKLGNGTSAQGLFFELALEDLGRAADLFKAPGTEEGLPAEAILAGVPISRGTKDPRASDVLGDLGGMLPAVAGKRAALARAS